ncbi:MAG: Na+/H+ antiporter NhaC family protein [Clostridia bacterium]|nr:Na+/H+ antiporter NhaC family protein [Clostridia bacterium]
MKKKIALSAFLVLAVAGLCYAVYGHSLDNYDFTGTAWSLLPPAVAIVLALITKEVYSSLFLGLVSGALLYSHFNTIDTLESVFLDGILSGLSGSSNLGILTFLVTLGILVSLLSRSGATKAYGRWAGKRIHSRRVAMLSTFALGVVLSVDDYFNTLTAGNVMRPITDANKISRAKLAYIIDATAAPMCMIMPISSWAAAVSANVENVNGVEMFLKAIPFNFYSLLTLAMVVFTSAMQFDYGPMKLHEFNAMNGDVHTVPAPDTSSDELVENEKGKLIDLLFPVILLIVSCISYMLYTGGLFDGKSLIDAFADCNASLALSMGALVTVGVTIIYYYMRDLLSFSELMESVAAGFKSMVPAILILIFAWSLSEITVLLGVNDFVSGVFSGSLSGLSSFLPALVYLVSVGLAFATGTSWGTMGIILPIVVGIGLDEKMTVIAISACLAGAVCGDHCSPISDTNIMSSTAAGCDHLAHVETQLPYAVVVLVISAITYVLAGFVKNAAICLPVAFATLFVTLFVIRKITKDKMPKQKIKEKELAQKA